MAKRFIGQLVFEGATSASALPVARFDLEESYNRGWIARIAVFAPGSLSLSLASMVGNAMAAGIVPGRSVIVKLGSMDDEQADDASEGATAANSSPEEDTSESENPITDLRAWPGIISNIEPLDPGQSRAHIYCLVTVTDIIGYLAGQKVWGAYRAEPTDEIVGGVISLAAGTSGKPTTTPVVPIQPNIKVISRLRENLNWLPFTIVAGQSLRSWLDQFYGLLGIRMEMIGGLDGSLNIILADGVPRDNPMEMSLPDEETIGTGSDSSEVAKHGELQILNLSARRGDYRRAVMLDDPTQGQIRVLGTGPVGTVVTGIQVGIDEAYMRAEQQLVTVASQLLVLTGESIQPGWQPGRRVTINRSIRGITTWQFHTVVHSLRGKTYNNRALMLNGEFVWHPPRPRRRAPVVVPAMVDGGPSLLAQEPVPRDRLGRIPVSFPFAPVISKEEEKIMEHDSNRDNILTREDFALELQQIRQKESDPEFEGAEAEFLLDTVARESDLQALRIGLLDDQDSDDASEANEELAKKRAGVYRYLAWKRFQSENFRFTATREEVLSHCTAQLNNPPSNNGDGAEHAERWQGAIDLLGAENHGGNGTEESGDFPREGLRSYALPYSAEGDATSRGWVELIELLDRKEELDRDRDQYITLRDEEISDEMAAELAENDDTRLRELSEKAKSRREGETDEDEEWETGMEDFSEKDQKLVEEYDAYFGDDVAPDWKTHIARLDAEAATQKWPPRVPLSILQPMAGGLHGFVSAHRQGDACRVAVHDPLWAEIVGFEYRRHRALSEGLTESTAGVVIEHDTQNAWTGMVFKRKEEDPDDDADDDTDGNTNTDTDENDNDGNQDDDPSDGDNTEDNLDDDTEDSA